jgi:hypothetical protein
VSSRYRVGPDRSGKDTRIGRGAATRPVVILNNRHLQQVPEAGREAYHGLDNRLLIRDLNASAAPWLTTSETQSMVHIDWRETVPATVSLEPTRSTTSCQLGPRARWFSHGLSALAL